MARKAAALPITGRRASTHEDAKRMAQEAGDGLVKIARDIATAGTKTKATGSDDALARAKREAWSRTGGPTHEPT